MLSDSNFYFMKIGLLAEAAASKPSKLYSELTYADCNNYYFTHRTLPPYSLRIHAKWSQSHSTLAMTG